MNIVGVYCKTLAVASGSNKDRRNLQAMVSRLKNNHKSNAQRKIRDEKGLDTFDIFWVNVIFGYRKTWIFLMMPGYKYLS
jgi:hypothetical protein